MLLRNTYRSWLLIVLFSCFFGAVLAQESRQSQYSEGLAKGIALYEDKDLVGSLTKLLNFVKTAERDPEELAVANHYIGKVFAESGLHEKAIKYLQDAEPGLTDPNLTLSLTELLGDQYLKLRELGKARKYYYALARQAHGKLDKEATAYQKLADSFNAGRGEQRDSVLHYQEKILTLAGRYNDAPLRIKAYNNLGYHYHKQQNYNQSIAQFESALSLAETGKDPVIVGQILLNQAIVLNNKGQQTKAIKNLKRARNYLFASGEDKDKASYYNLIAGFYLKNGDVYRAELYSDSAIAAGQSSKDPESLMTSYQLTANVKNYYADYKAENRYQRMANNIKDSLSQTKNQEQQLALLRAFDLERQENATIIAMQDAKIAEERAVTAEKEKLLAVEEAKVSEREKELVEQRAQVLERDKKLALERIRVVEQEKELALQQFTISRQEFVKDSIQLRLEAETLRKDKLQRDNALERARADQAIKARQLEESKRDQLLGFSFLLGIILILALASLVYIRRANRNLKAKNEEILENERLIALEKEKSDLLLRNILPKDTADELKAYGSATSKNYEKVSILFTDFKGFTQISEQLTPRELVDELNRYFIRFDEISSKHNLEKIKTIGDAYMCAGGIPQSNDTHAADAVRAALAMIQFVEEVNVEKRAKGLACWNIRVGIHTGPVVAGVVGKDKFAYDIWGDAVNTASRIESSGEAGRLNISHSTYVQVKEQFRCRFRGEIEAKNKGAIRMYFVDGVAEAVKVVPKEKT